MTFQKAARPDTDVSRFEPRVMEPRLPDNPPPGPKRHAKQGLARMNLNGSEYAVMVCLIDRANQKTGLCYPSESYIAGWTMLPLRTVERAVASLDAKPNLLGIVAVKTKQGVSNRYFINWRPLFEAYRQMKAFEKQKVAGPSPSKVAGPHPSKVAGEPMKRLNL